MKFLSKNISKVIKTTTSSAAFDERVVKMTTSSFERCLLYESDVIMTAMASQITSLTIAYSTVYWGADQTAKLCVTGLCVGNSPVTGEFPTQMACNAENVSIWWRHHEYVTISADGSARYRAAADWRTVLTSYHFAGIWQPLEHIHSIWWLWDGQRTSGPLDLVWQQSLRGCSNR